MEKLKSQVGQTDKIKEKTDRKLFFLRKKYDKVKNTGFFNPFSLKKPKKTQKTPPKKKRKGKTEAEAETSDKIDRNREEQPHDLRTREGKAGHP